jgi:hypothetical protein
MGKEPKHHDHVAYLASIKARAESKARSRERFQSVVRAASKLLGITPKPDSESAKSQKEHPYIVAKKGSYKGTDIITAPRVTPPAYVQAKRKATQAYDYTNQRQKIKAPFPTRS